MTKNIKTQIFILLLILLFYSVYSNSASTTTVNSAPEEGWYKTQWGMTIDEIRAAIQEEIKEVTPENRRRFATDYTYIIPNFKIGDFNFDVYMSFDTNKKLNKVMVRLNDGQDYNKCFSELETSLKKKYGNPASIKDDHLNLKIEKVFFFKSREWLSKNTIITLNYSEMTSIGNKLDGTTDIMYESRKDNFTDKL